MNGPQHYLEAQRLDAQAGELASQAFQDQRPEPIDWLLRRAQVAATRAQVHATLAGVAVALGAHGCPASQQEAWDEVAR